MNELTIPSKMQSAGYSDSASLTVHLAKMLALVAPITMSSEQQEIWLRAAVDALDDIRASEVEAVSTEIRRSVTRPAQIVPEIARLVGERRKREQFIREYEQPKLEGPPLVKHISDRDRRNFTADDWAELNEHLERMGSSVRYRSDGSRYEAKAA